MQARTVQSSDRETWKTSATFASASSSKREALTPNISKYHQISPKNGIGWPNAKLQQIALLCTALRHSKKFRPTSPLAASRPFKPFQSKSKQFKSKEKFLQLSKFCVAPAVLKTLALSPEPLPFRQVNSDFQRRAHDAMLHDGFRPDFPPEVLAEANAAQPASCPTCKDLRDLAWSSIDNTQSRDLDQIEWAERLTNGAIRVLVGIADVDAVVQRGTKLDEHAKFNCTSVYTGGPTFPMLPERLSTDLTSLKQDADRVAVIIEFDTCLDGDIANIDVYPALVRNRARLNYDEVGKWLQGQAAEPASFKVSDEIIAQLRLQHEASQRLIDFRKNHGALTLGGVENIPVVVNNEVHGFEAVQQNPARDIIEAFMVAANVAMARHLRARGCLAIRRVVRTPRRWDRIQCIAGEHGTKLPDTPDPGALNAFLAKQKQADPDHYPELSLAVLKSLGPGEYIVEKAGAEREGHFGLAVNDYTHSTAPNRRYADLVIQRLVKQACGPGAKITEEELTKIAQHCNERESAARHVERFMKKVAAAMLLQKRIGEKFDAIVTGATPKGTFARLLGVPAEGRIVHGEQGLDVGQKTSVRLKSVDVQNGFIDLERL
jgi:VacB/RNase II family 3'-5' exoribonuclease